MRNTFVNTIIETHAEDDSFFVLVGDAGVGVFDHFGETHAHRFLNMGVAEQNMASFAAGLSLAGFNVLMYNIIPFLLYRCYEQVRNDICYQRLPIVMARIGSGVTYAPAGMTHYAVEDLGLARTLPNLAVCSPCDPIEARLIAQWTSGAQGPIYVRLAKRGEPNLHRTDSFDVTRPVLLRDGNDVAIVFHGSIGIEVVQARISLTELGVFPKVISMPMVQPVAVERFLQLTNDVRLVLVGVEHYADSGLGHTPHHELIGQVAEFGSFNHFSLYKLAFDRHLMGQQHGWRAVRSSRGDEHLKEQRLVEFVQESSGFFAEISRSS